MIKTTMNKKIILPFLALALMLAGCILISCKDNNGTGLDTGKAAKAQCALYIMDQMFDYCDMTVTIDGTTVTLTTDNTTATTYTSEIGKTYNVRKYDITDKSFFTFPSSFSYEAKCQPKSDISISSLGTVDFCFAVITEVHNDSEDSWDHINCSNTFQPSQNLNIAKVIEKSGEEGALNLLTKDITTTITFSSAKSVDVVYSK